MAELLNTEGRTLRRLPRRGLGGNLGALEDIGGHFYTLAKTVFRARARFVYQSKNGASGPEIRFRWGACHAGNSAKPRLAVLMTHRPPAQKREMTNQITRAAG